MTLILMFQWDVNLRGYPHCGSSCKFISTDAGTFQWGGEEKDEEDDKVDEEDGEEVDDYDEDDYGGVYYRY